MPFCGAAFVCMIGKNFDLLTDLQSRIHITKCEFHLTSLNRQNFCKNNKRLILRLVLIFRRLAQLGSALRNVSKKLKTVSSCLIGNFENAIVGLRFI